MPIRVEGARTTARFLASVALRCANPSPGLEIAGTRLIQSNLNRSLQEVDPGGNPWVPFAWDRKSDGGWRDSGGRRWGRGGFHLHGARPDNRRPGYARSGSVGDKLLQDTMRLLNSVVAEARGKELTMTVEDDRENQRGIPVWAVHQDAYDPDTGHLASPFLLIRKTWYGESDQPGDFHVPERAFLGISEHDADQAAIAVMRYIDQGWV